MTLTTLTGNNSAETMTTTNFQVFNFSFKIRQLCSLISVVKLRVNDVISALQLVKF